MPVPAILTREDDLGFGALLRLVFVPEREIDLRLVVLEMAGGAGYRKTSGKFTDVGLSIRQGPAPPEFL